MMFWLSVPGSGSSPRGRGTLLGREHEQHRRRFIPARAGNTCARSAAPASAAVHPRAGGEHVWYCAHTPPATGSSPRGRGTRRHRHGRLHPDRFIPARAGNTGAPGMRRPWRSVHPARAGNTCRPGCGCRPSPVHPRAGGEHEEEGFRGLLNQGSSPRGRGTLRDRLIRVFGFRFIPARAGNTPSWADRPCSASVHPRAGGEHTRTRRSERPSTGSSPRGRGTHLGDWRPPVAVRFIPARAGNTSSPSARSASPTVHPRAGGEHMVMSTISVSHRGSSPRGRGTLLPVSRVGRVERFIPARAGNTPGRLRIPGIGPVHPRAGGEHHRNVVITYSPRGSSPRGRGTPWASAGISVGRRFILARAGNTKSVSQCQHEVRCA